MKMWCHASGLVLLFRRLLLPLAAATGTPTPGPIEANIFIYTHIYIYRYIGSYWPLLAPVWVSLLLLQAAKASGETEARDQKHDTTFP